MNKKQFIYFGIFFIIAVMATYGFIRRNTSSSEENLFFKEMSLIYSGELSKAILIDGGYSGVINYNNATPELLIFKENPTLDEQEADLLITVYYHNNKQTQQLEFKYTDRAFFCHHLGKTFGVFTIELPQVEIENIEIKIFKYRTSHSDWETIIKPENNKNVTPLVIESSTYSLLELPNSYRYSFTESLEKAGIKSLPYSYTIKNDSLFQSIEILDTYIDENKVTILTIDNPNIFWEAINSSSQNFDYCVNGEEANTIIPKLASLNTSQIDTILDINKLANYEALKNIFTSGCNDKQYFIFNKTSNLLEPFFVNSSCLGEMAKIVKAPLINSEPYISIYSNLISRITNEALPKVENKDLFKQELALINSYNPSLVFKESIIKANKNLLKNSLYSSTLLLSNFISISKKNIQVSVHNVSNYPIKIKALNYKSNKRITSLSPSKTIASGEKKIINIPLPRSFENLFVHKKAKETGFKYYKDIYDLRLLFTLASLDSIHKVSILPYEEEEEIEEDLFRKKTNISENPFVIVNNETKEVVLLKSVTINQPLIIPSGYIFKALEGTMIDIVKGGKIISNSPLKFIGTKENPIKIYSSDKKGQGMIVLAEGKNSYLEHVFITNLTNPSHGYWMVTGVLTFYESPVQLKYVSISNNRSEDALNIVRANFLISNCTISNTQSDAFDGDFVVGIIKDSNFTNLGNDAIDISGSDISIINVTIKKAGDKGLSAGENSKMKLDNVTISDCEIGIAGKDLSTVEGKNITIKNNKLAFTAFKKKPEFGPSHIKLTEVSLVGVETEYLIEDKSSLIFNGKKATTIKNVKSKMYGVEFGKSSKDTRGN